MEKSLNRILLVDDDIALCQLLSEFLVGVNFDVEAVHDGERAIQLLKSNPTYDAVVLDIMMPRVSGLDVLQSVRRTSDIPIIMLTGRGDDVDRIVGLELGADDYLGKPCNPRELAARINAVLRRSQNKETNTESQEVISHLGVVLNPSTLAVDIQGKDVSFTSAEFRVLQLLMKNAGQALSKEYLTQQVLHRPLSAHDRSIDVHISRIRQKLSAFDGLSAVIKSVRGVGYQMVAEAKVG